MLKNNCVFFLEIIIILENNLEFIESKNTLKTLSYLAQGPRSCLVLDFQNSPNSSTQNWKKILCAN